MAQKHKAEVRLACLQQQHATLEKQLEKLSQCRNPTGTLADEIARTKAHKLRVKDELMRLQHALQTGVAEQALPQSEGVVVLHPSAPPEESSSLHLVGVS